ncbi:hypothetical protein G9A89_017782 [Geosiphon pyriformis]|nr:hypothetical protein G9A89_017782 [Geosiphon pyriformis]
MKEVAKNSGADSGFRPVLSRKKRKGGVLAENVLVKRDVIETIGNHSQISESGDTTKSESIDMEEECLVEETSINYGESDAFNGRDSNQILKSSGLKIKTKKVLGKPLGKINFEDGFDDGDFLNESVLLPPPLSLKSSVQVSVHKFFTLDIDLVAITGKSSQEKSNFIKKIFSDVNGFGGASTLLKFGGIICVTFTSEKAMMAAANLANKHDVVVNTNLKHPGYNRTNQAIVLKEIPVGTFIETVCAAVSEFGIIKSIKMQLTNLLVSMWSILIGKNAVCVARANIDKQTWDSRDRFRALLYTLLIGTNVHNLWDFLVSVGRKTCIIDHNFVNYTHAYCATMCFDFEEDMNQAVAVMPIIKNVGLHWLHLSSSVCSACDFLGHTSLLVKIYEKKLAPISHLLAFGGKTWASVAGSSPWVVLLATILNLLILKAVLPTSQDKLLPVTTSSQNQEEDIVMEMGSGEATSGKTAAVLGSNASPEVVKLENMLEGLSALVISLLACLDGLALAGGDIIHWHKDMNNLVSIFMELKLKGRVHPWLADKFDGVRVFTSGLDSGSLGAGVMIIVNSSLVKHVYKVSEVPDQLLFIRLLFKNKLLVSILGLYAGASLVVWFSQAGKINSLIAKTVNEFSFVILGGNFNENGFQKCVSFKKCLELGLVNSLIGSLAIRMLTWANFRGATKTINYVFVSLNLVNSLVHCGVSDVSDYFNTDHQAVSVSLGLSGLLDTHLFSFHKQTNKDHWKFNVKNASETKWLKFKDAMAANTVMFSGVFSNTDVIHKIIVLSTGGTFKKRWFKGFDMVYNRVSSRFYKLELLVFKLVKASCLSSSVNNLDSAGVSLVKSMFHSGVKFNDICSALAKVRRLYHSSKLLESKYTEESHIRQTINNRMESFELDKDCIIRNVLEHPFHKVVLDHLVINDELVFESDLVKKRVVVDDISDTWFCQYKSLDYVFDNVFSGVISEIDVDKLYCVVFSLPDEKAAGLLDISNELWKCCDKSVLGLLLVLLNSCLSYVLTNTCPIVLIKTVRKILSKILSDRILLACSSYDVLHGNNFSVLKGITTQSPIFAVGSVIEDALEKN